MTSYIGKIIHRVCEDKLDQKDVEIARLMQLLSQRDAELARKDIELDQKKSDISRLMQELRQELFQTENEHDAKLIKLQQSIHDLTIVEPIDIQVKLSEMFESCAGNMLHPYPSRGQLDEVVTKIRAATEQIKEPIMDLFYVTYTNHDHSPWNTKSDITLTAFILTTSDVYKLDYSGRSPHETHSIFISNTMVIDRYSYEWVKVGSMDRSINWKTLRKYIATTSGFTGNLYSNTNANSPTTGSGDKVAEQLSKNMLALVMDVI